MPGSPAPYIGRFAPSPSGALHFGSLLAALASFLDARANGGHWLVRMEDLDPDREPPGAADEILRLLDSMHLHWDGPVLYQSTRLEAYREALEQLDSSGLTYPCNCTRKRVRALGGVYDNHCRGLRQQPPGPSAIRVKTDNRPISFVDCIQGEYTEKLDQSCGDFIIRRKDGLTAYQLAVVVDDAWQEISHIVRGHDLLGSTPRQILLQHLLRHATPAYAHIPVASNDGGQKLSKQHFAKPLAPEDSSEQMYRALLFLGQDPPPSLRRETPPLLLQWATQHWDIQKVPRLATITIRDG